MSILLLFIILSILILVVLGISAFASRRSEEIAIIGASITLAMVILVAVEYALLGFPLLKSELTYYGHVTFGFIIDSLSILISIMVAINGFATILFSQGYMSPANKEHPVKKEEVPRYYGWLLLFEASALGFIFSSTLLTMIIFFELTSLCSWALISYYGTPEARKAGLEAFIIAHIATIGLYVATGIVYIEVGSISIFDMMRLNNYTKTIVLACLLIATIGKSAQVPLHVWLPRAMVAPTPVSAYLHAAAMVKLGVYMMIRILLTCGFTEIIAYACIGIGIITMIYGCIMYFPQHDLKRLLAYSTITQLSYILIATGISALDSNMALKGAIFHIFNHGFAKELFFLSVGAIAFATGTRFINDLSGLKIRKDLSVGFTVAALAIAGVPPFNCFWSKLLIILGSYSTLTPLGIFVGTVMLIESIVCFAWFLRIFSKCVSGDPSLTVRSAQSIPTVMKLILYLLVVLVIISPLFAGPFLSHIIFY